MYSTSGRLQGQVTDPFSPSSAALGNLIDILSVFIPPDFTFLKEEWKWEEEGGKRKEEGKCWWCEGGGGWGAMVGYQSPGVSWRSRSMASNNTHLTFFFLAQNFPFSHKNMAESSNWQICCKVTQDTSVHCCSVASQVSSCFPVQAMWVLWSATGLGCFLGQMDLPVQLRTASY